MLNSSISVIVPAFNEEGNLPGACETVRNAVTNLFSDWEVIIFDDCSTDNTGKVADSLSSKDIHVRVIHNPVNRGFGWNYREGVRLARMEYVLMVPGDNEIDGVSLGKMLKFAGIADILIPYPENSRVRPPIRRLISKVFVRIINELFRLEIRYYNGIVLHKREIIQKIPIQTEGFAYQAEILVKLVRSGCSYAEVGMRLQPRFAGKSKAFKPKNILSVLNAIIKLFWEVHFQNPSFYSMPTRIVQVSA